MQLVLLAGELGEKYGERHEYFNLQTPADAIKLLCINYPALKQEMMQAHHNGVRYKVIQGGSAMRYDELNLPFGSKPLFVVPIISGAGGGATTQILAGVGLVAASFIFPGAGLFGKFGLMGAAGTGALTSIGTGLSAIGAGLILQGTANIISPMPELTNLGANRIRGEGSNVRGPGPDGITRGAMGHENYAFTGPANTVGTGATVPVIYGRVIAGSHLVAANLVVSDDSDPLKTTTQAPGVETFRVNGDAIERQLKKAGGLLTRRKTRAFNNSVGRRRVFYNDGFGQTVPLKIDESIKIKTSTDTDDEGNYFTLDYKKDVDKRKKLDIIFKLGNGLYDFVGEQGTTKIDGFIRYRIEVSITGENNPRTDANPIVSTAEVTVQGLLLRNQTLMYGHRLKMPAISNRAGEDVEIKITILDLGVHANANFIINAYGYDLLNGED